MAAKKVSKAEFQHSMRKRMVDVSQTKFDPKSKRVIGPKGNLFTGAVDMGGGRTQTYEKGRRVTVSKKMKGFRDAPKKTATKTGASSRGEKDSTKKETKVADRKATSATVTSALSAKAPRKSSRSTTSGTVTSAKAKGKSIGRQTKSGTVSSAISNASRLTPFGEWLKGFSARQEARPKGYKNPYKRGY